MRQKRSNGGAYRAKKRGRELRKVRKGKGKSAARLGSGWTSSLFRGILLRTVSGLGIKIRAERKKRSISQSELARKVGTPRTHLVAIEMGRRGIGLSLLSRISIVLGVQINFFLDKAKVEGAKIAPRVRKL